MDVGNRPGRQTTPGPWSNNVPSNPQVRQWVDECAALCEPAQVEWLSGSAEERQDLIRRAVAEGVLITLNQEKLPGCYLHRSNPNDVARTEQFTYICTPSQTLAGPTNNWLEPKAAYAKLRAWYSGCMRGRTMYVIPFIMGPRGSPLTQVGVQVTDSLYVAISMGIMTRMGTIAWEQLGDGNDFIRCLHAVADCNPERRAICHFPLDQTIWSFGSGYGGNALLGKKCLALRIAGFLGYQNGWMAEHMLIVGITDPEGETTYVAAAFPSACGKTNFAMLIPPEKYAKAGWQVRTIGDDIAWMYVNPSDGRLWGLNPEAGYFGVLPGTNWKTNPNAMKIIAKDTVYTNVALLPDGDVWWEGKTDTPPAECIDWTGQPWRAGSVSDRSRPAAHPNSRFTAPMHNNPALDPHVDDPAGVPISALIFGGRRSKTSPLVYQAFNWIHGVYLGATLSSETTAAATGQVGVLRRDPMAMLPFCGYNMNYYFTHWIRMRKSMKDCPRIFHVNWFRTDDRGKYLWPGFGENMRVVKWIVDRCRGRGYAAETMLGWMPRVEDFDLEGLAMTREQFEAVQTVTIEDMKRELLTQEELFLKLAGELPKELIFQREMLIARL
ncbi:MAG: phosphoenolpyruvate carboxykinase (GTP) [Acidobacteria bacterium]|nr:MAG: phosphoenolpyruvate carboxykinase (GTP) [Acidobacteriota bacterium]